MKTFGTGLSALVLACLVLVGVSPQPVSAEFSQCKDFPYQYSFTGVEGYGIAVPQRYGVRAYVDVSSGYFGPCTEGGGFDSASAWVSMEPHPSAPEGNNTWAILQIGLINCNNPAWTACNGQALHAFWARGGCNYNAPEPYDLGVTDASVHEFAVKKNLTSETYILTMDGVTAITIWASNTAINCWIAGQREITWFGERVDRGDSLGDFSPTNTRLRWTSARYQSALGGTWKDPNWPIGNQCPWHQHNSNCTYPAAQTLHMWTTYLP